MVLDRRVTLRCMTDDLVSGWADAAQWRVVKIVRELAIQHSAKEIPKSKIAHYLRQIPRFNTLDHPLIQHFDGAFGPDYDATSTESISGLTKPHWWKQKTQQWRGAATDHSMVGADSVWLCAAGTRRDGDGGDFYKAFMRNVGRTGPTPYLPTTEDHLIGEIDEKITAFDAWKLQIHCSALALLAEGCLKSDETHSIQFTGPSRMSNKAFIGEFSVSIEVVNVEGIELCEVFLVATILDRSHIKEVDVACQIARAALQSDAEEWNATPYVTDAFAFSALADPRALSNAETLARKGTLPEECRPGGLRIGLRAHYAREQGIVSAQVEGSALLSLCGYWFVPVADPEKLEICIKCLERHGQLNPA